MPSARISPPRIFPAATRASRPPADAAGAADAHRQAGFVLGDDIAAVLDGFNLEGDIARDAAGAKYRNHVVAPALAVWSRGWLARLQALHALEWGNYASAFPLLQFAAASQESLASMLETQAADWADWLEQDGIANAHDAHALEYRLRPPPAQEHAATGVSEIARAAEGLASTAHAATMAIAGSASTPERIAVTFGDRDFHLALAEMQIGWLAALSSAQLGTAIGSGVFPTDHVERVAQYDKRVATMLDRKDRARIEAVERDHHPRWLIHNWRRSPGAAPKRLLL